jgi:hypothetical protein
MLFASRHPGKPRPRQVNGLSTQARQNANDLTHPRSSRTQATRVEMASGNSPLAKILTRSPGFSTSEVRTPTPRSEIVDDARCVVLGKVFGFEHETDWNCRWLALPSTGNVGGTLLHGQPLILYSQDPTFEGALIVNVVRTSGIIPLRVAPGLVPAAHSIRRWRIVRPSRVASVVAGYASHFARELIALPRLQRLFPPKVQS